MRKVVIYDSVSKLSGVSDTIIRVVFLLVHKKEILFRFFDSSN